jgi:3-hydroxyacyl-[acyl-carrier-protein] dehydratase
MRFNLVDRILELEPGRRIVASKNLTLGEEYLADHFPTFPVMPGVLMLQALVEAGSWLLRVTEDFQHSMIALREARNVKYGQFVTPGQELILTVELGERNEVMANLKGKGAVEGVQTVGARLTLARYNLASIDPSWHSQDERMVEQQRRHFAMIHGQRL